MSIKRSDGQSKSIFHFELHFSKALHPVLNSPLKSSLKTCHSLKYILISTFHTYKKVSNFFISSFGHKSNDNFDVKVWSDRTGTRLSAQNRYSIDNSIETAFFRDQKKSCEQRMCANVLPEMCISFALEIRKHWFQYIKKWTEFCHLFYLT